MFALRTTRSLLAVAGLAAVALPALGQGVVLPSVTVAPTYSSAATPAYDTPAPLPLFTADQLDQLVGAIALYPDPLLAQVLPAATYPLDIVRAARFLQSGGADADIELQDWDPSVQAVAHYPTVLALLDQNLEWTQQLGQAFLAQPDGVILAVQRQRAKAQQLGNLTSTVQQAVVYEDQAIRILPANPDIIYIPDYQPSVVYYTPAPVYTTYITFGTGYTCGTWLDLDCDWRDRWFYRPGWTWNRWHDHYLVDSGRLRPRHDFAPRRDGHDRPSNVWHRDDHRPLVLPHRQWSDRGDSDRGGFNRDRSRSRDRDSNRPTVINTPSRGDSDHTRGNLDRPTSRPDNRPSGRPNDRPGGRGNQPPANPTPAPSPSRDHTRSNLQRPTSQVVPAPSTPPTPRVERPRAGSDRPRAGATRSTPPRATPAPTPAPTPTPAPSPAPSTDHTARGLMRPAPGQPAARPSPPTSPNRDANSGGGRGTARGGAGGGNGSGSGGANDSKPKESGSPSGGRRGGKH